MRKYASDLISGDKIIDKRTERTVIIDWIDTPADEHNVGTLEVYGYFEDDGTDWTRTLDRDSIVRVP